jgi:hypothetical protein
MDRAQIVLAEIELTTSATCASADGEDDCGDREAGPALVNLPVDGTTKVALDGVVPAGTYSGLHAKVDAVSPEDEPAGSDFLTAHPDFRGISVKVTGIFTDAGHQAHAFTFAAEVDAQVGAAFRPPVTVGPNTSHLTIDVDAPSWFQDPTGVLMDPRDAANARAIARNIRESFKAIEHDHED